jgi:uncharacterized membrane protein
MLGGLVNSLVGVWLLAAPLIFWSPDAAAYVNDSLVGILVIAFSLIIPMGHSMEGPDVPPGWSYNPSTWPQRAPIIALGLAGLLLSRYMAAFQLGYIAHAWDPFFGGSTERVLTSKVSRMWPVSDAALGAMAYTLEVLMGFMGDKRRWRTMPWMVTFFGILVVPLGVTSIVLVILQPIAVGAWCSLCLAAALAMLVMIPLTLDEVVAMVQFLARKRRAGESLWRAFWLGGDVAEGGEAKPTRPEGWSLKPMLWGFTPAAALVASAALGLWLLFAPAVFGLPMKNPLSDSDHLVGALIVVVAVIAMAEVARPIRLVNALLGFWLLTAPWLLSGGSTAARVNDSLIGAAVVLLALPLGSYREHYGKIDRSLTWSLNRLRKVNT